MSRFWVARHHRPDEIAPRDGLLDVATVTRERGAARHRSHASMTEGARILLDGSVAAAFEGRPPNKFTRLLETLTRSLPDAITGRMTQHGFFRQTIATFDPTFDYTRAVFPPPSPTVGARGWASFILLSHAAAVRLPLPEGTKARLKDAGAFHLGARLAALTPRQRRFFHRAFDLDRDAARREQFTWWSDACLKQAAAPPLLASASTKLHLGPEDTVVLAGVAGNVAVPPTLHEQKERDGFKVVVVLLEIGPFVCPSITDIGDYRRVKLTLERLVAVADLLIVPSSAMAAQLPGVLNGLALVSPPVSILHLPLGVSPHGPRSAVARIFELSRSRRFALAVTTFKRRKNFAWVVAAWKRAARLHGATLPHLVIVASVIEERRAWLVTNDSALQELVTVVPQPTDAELRWLFDHAAFVVQPPSHNGLGLAIAEAISFGKPVLCEAQPSNVHPAENGLVTALDLDMDRWVAAIGAAAESSATSERATKADSDLGHRPLATDDEEFVRVRRELTELLTRPRE